MKILTLCTAAILLSSPLPSSAQEATRVEVPNGVRPCAVVSLKPADVEKEIRRLKRQGLLVTVRRGAQQPQTVSDGSFTFPMSLSRARVAVSGC